MTMFLSHFLHALRLWADTYTPKTMPNLTKRPHYSQPAAMPAHSMGKLNAFWWMDRPSQEPCACIEAIWGKHGLQYIDTGATTPAHDQRHTQEF